ncbi:MAG: adenylyltransferase/cytidyltransferase family protein [Opitutales bacterium]
MADAGTDLLTSPKMLDLASALRERDALRASHERLVLTNGCFDLLHAGHVAFLQSAAKLGDQLWVLLNSDASVRALKGPHRPLQDERARAFCLAALACVRAVIVFPNPRLDAEIRLLQPDIYTKAGDYTLETLDPGERTALKAAGTQIRFLSFIEGFSTTRLVERVCAAGSL